MRFIFILLCVLFLISCVSANLQISQTEINVNKTYGDVLYFNINVTNDGSFKFYNITFEEDIVNLPKFELEAGQSKEVEVGLTTNDNYDGVLTLRGDYEAELGQSNQTEVVEVYYNYGFDKCDLELIEGDTIVWINNVLDEIDLVNSGTGQTFATILEDSNYSNTFNYPQEFDYYASRIGLRFTDICRINIRDDSGLIHSSAYDDTINLNVNILYDPTTISTNFFGTNITLEYDKTKEDIFSIENVGSNVAKNIHFSGDWFTFTKNDIDLGVGESTTVGFKITPVIFATEDTNKTYNKTIEITGNFGTYRKDFEIFVPYSDISGSIGDLSVNQEWLKNLIKYLCQENPDWEECKREIVNGSSSANITAQFSADTIKKILERQAQKEDEQELYQKMQTEIDLNQTQELSSIRKDMVNWTMEFVGLREDFNDLGTVIAFSVILVLFTSCVICIILFINKFGGRVFVKRRFNFHKGERSY